MLKFLFNKDLCGCAVKLVAKTFTLLSIEEKPIITLTADSEEESFSWCLSLQEGFSFYLFFFSHFYIFFFFDTKQPLSLQTKKRTMKK